MDARRFAVYTTRLIHWTIKHLRRGYYVPRFSPIFFLSSVPFLFLSTLRVAQWQRTFHEVKGFTIREESYRHSSLS